MYLLPVGDDISKRTLPLMGMLLIGATALVAVYELRVWWDSRPLITEAEEVVPVKFFDVDRSRHAADQSLQTEQRVGVKVIDVDPELEPEELESEIPIYSERSLSALDVIFCTWGLVPTDLAKGRTIGLLTHMFLHDGLLHLLGNLLTLWLFLPTMEACLGSRRFLLFYLLWGMAGGLLQAYMNWGSDIPLIGASGAISGVIGAYLVTFGPLANINCLFYGGILTGYEAIKLRIPASLYVFFWLVVPNLIGIAQAAETGIEQVGWYAHAGGFVAGIVTMRLFAWDARRRLTATADGDIEIQHPQDEAAAETAQNPVKPPTTCPYCRGPIAAENKFDDMLYRCPNTDCQRLILLPVGRGAANASQSHGFNVEQRA